MALKTYSERTILAQLDRHAEEFDFPTLDNGDPSLYKSTRTPNTHWSNWPAGGTL